MSECRLRSDKPLAREVRDPDMASPRPNESGKSFGNLVGSGDAIIGVCQYRLRHRYAETIQ